MPDAQPDARPHAQPGAARDLADGATIVLNGDAHALPNDARLTALLDALALRPEWVLVELNGEPVARERYADVTLRAGDRLELVTPLAGG